MFWIGRLIFFGIVGGMIALNLVWWRWAHRRTRGPARAVLALWMVFGLAFPLAILCWPDQARRVHYWMPMPLVAAGYLWNMMVLPLSLLGIGLGKPLRRRPKVEERRGFLTACAVAAPPLLSGLTAAYTVARMDDFRVRRFRLEIPALPPALEGLTIAQVADLHVGKFTSEEMLERAVLTVNEMEADLVLLPGDLIDLSLADLDDAIGLVKRMQSRYGSFLCEGNHDRIEDGDAFARRVRAAGLSLLVDEAATIAVNDARVQLLGLSWQRGGEASAAAMARLGRARDPGAFPILLGHHPHSVDLHGDIPLTLAGHTHGGQIMINEDTGAGPLLYRYWSGVYKRPGRTLVVSNGVGNWFPLRTRAPAEIVHLVLQTPRQC